MNDNDEVEGSGGRRLRVGHVLLYISGDAQLGKNLQEKAVSVESQHDTSLVINLWRTVGQRKRRDKSAPSLDNFSIFTLLGAVAKGTRLQGERERWAPGPNGARRHRDSADHKA